MAATLARLWHDRDVTFFLAGHYCRYGWTRKSGRIGRTKRAQPLQLIPHVAFVESDVARCHLHAKNRTILRAMKKSYGPARNIYNQRKQIEIEIFIIFSVFFFIFSLFRFICFSKMKLSSQKHVLALVSVGHKIWIRLARIVETGFARVDYVRLCFMPFSAFDDFNKSTKIIDVRIKVSVRFLFLVSM